MSTPTKIEKYVSLFFQIVAAVVLGIASVGKFMGGETDLYIFVALNIESSRLIIATIEGISALLLLSRSPHWGALLGFGTMVGALIAHLSVLGLVVKGDGGKHALLLTAVLLSTIVVMWIWRRRLPLIGHTFSD